MTAPTRAKPGSISTDILIKEKDTHTMSNDLVKPGGLIGALMRGAGSNYLTWKATSDWADRDGLKPPSPLLVISTDIFVRRWNGEGQPPTIKPLCDVAALNAEIPEEEWPIGLNGEPEKPWKVTYGVLLVNPETGELYSYAHNTFGAKVAYETLHDRMLMMCDLRGENVRPLVNLTKKPMKSKKWGTVMRPDFEIVGWKVTPGGGGQALPAQSAPQLAAPATAPAAPPAEAPPPTAPNKPASKPSINISTKKDAIDALTDAAPVTSEELLNDSIPW
jgi:hypothetical protein